MTDKKTLILVREIANLRRELSETQGILTEAFQRIYALESKANKANDYHHWNRKPFDEQEVQNILRRLHGSGN